MKAKEYFRKFKEENQEETNYYRVVKALMDIFNEIDDIKNIRKANSDSAMIAIFNEQNLKANSFIKMVNKFDADLDIKSDAFKIFVINQFPKIAKLINWN